MSSSKPPTYIYIVKMTEQYLDTSGHQDDSSEPAVQTLGYYISIDDANAKALSTLDDQGRGPSQWQEMTDGKDDDDDEDEDGDEDEDENVDHMYQEVDEETGCISWELGCVAEDGSEGDHVKVWVEREVVKTPGSEKMPKGVKVETKGGVYTHLKKA